MNTPRPYPKRRFKREDRPRSQYLTMAGADWDIVGNLMVELDRSRSEVISFAVRHFEASIRSKQQESRKP